MPADLVSAAPGAAGTAVTFSVRLDADSAAALDAICARLGCRRAEAVRRALAEAAASGDVLARLERIEALLRAAVAGRAAIPPPSGREAPLAPPGTSGPAAAATIRNLSGWGGGE